MNQGAKRHALSERGNDLYESPGCAPAALLLHEPLLGAAWGAPNSYPSRPIVWEPCAGRGAIARVLRASGHEVITHDLVAYEGADPGIEAPRDFFKTERPPIGCGVIVTNPPFMHADAFVRHGLSLQCDVIVLLRLMAIEGANRSDLIDRHCHRIWAGIERLPMMHREGWTGPKIKGGNSGAPFAWFVFRSFPRQPGAPIELRRISWRVPVPVPTAEVNLFEAFDAETDDLFAGLDA